MKRKTVWLIAIVLAACAAMGIVDAVIQPGYITKSAIKIALFLLLPILYARGGKNGDLKKLLKPGKRGLISAVLAGIGIYVLIVGAYFLTKDIFDFSALTTSLTQTTGVNKSNFVWVALYISFVNSLLEEFFFRGFAFLTLKKIASRSFAYSFSAGTFAAYHIAMMLGWFDFIVIVLALMGLFVGGLIFNRCNEKRENIWLSWLIHMFANFATNTIGFILFAA